MDHPACLAWRLPRQPAAWMRQLPGGVSDISSAIKYQLSDQRRDRTGARGRTHRPAGGVRVIAGSILNTADTWRGWYVSQGGVGNGQETGRKWVGNGSKHHRTGRERVQALPNRSRRNGIEGKKQSHNMTER